MPCTCGGAAPSCSGPARPARPSRWRRPAPRPTTWLPSPGEGRWPRSCPAWCSGSCPAWPTPPASARRTPPAWACPAPRPVPPSGTPTPWPAPGPTRRCPCLPERGPTWSPVPSWPAGTCPSPTSSAGSRWRCSSARPADRRTARHPHSPEEWSVNISVWAPRAERSLEVVVGELRTALAPGPRGRWSGEVPALGPGVEYALSVDGGPPRPDPRSPHQPHGVHGPSRVVDHDAFAWTDAAWRGFHLPGAVLYELHVGTFSEIGTFAGAIEHLDHLVALGVDAVELMPVAEFSGQRGWG